MHPIILRYQKEIGIVTFLFFSVAIHCIKKREKKQNCANRPRMSQKLMFIYSVGYRDLNSFLTLFIVDIIRVKN